MKFYVSLRATKWMAAKEEARSRVKDLATIFGSESTVRQSKKSVSLQRWFLDLERQIDEQLTLDSPKASAGIAAQITEALTSAEYLDKLESNWQVKQLMSETKAHLKRLIRCGH